MNKREALRRRARRWLWAAAVLSLLLHGAAMLLFAWFHLLPLSEPPPPPAEDEIEITFVPPVLPQDMPKQFLRTTPEQVADRPPEQAIFESDQDTLAASDQPPDGDLPLPSQKGDEIPVIETTRRELALAEPDPRPPSPPMPPAPPDAARPVAPPQRPKPEPAASPRPKTTPKPSPTPPERPPSEDPLYAMAQPQPRQEVVEPPQEKPAEPPRPEARPPSAPSFQPQTRPTRIQGSLSNRRGPPSLDAIATPLGRYKKQISDAIGSRWYAYIGSRMDLVSIGSVQIQFVITRSGRITRPRVISNTSNESFENFSLLSILDAKIPPIPDEVAATLENGQMEIEYTFTILSN